MPGTPPTSATGAKPIQAMCSGRATSDEALVSPERDEVAVDVVAERGDLAGVAGPQLCHQPLVDLVRRAVNDLALKRREHPAARAVRRQRLARSLQSPRRRPAADDERVEQFGGLL